MILRPKNVIFEPFWPFSKFHFPACATLFIMQSFFDELINVRALQKTLDIINEIRPEIRIKDNNETKLIFVA